jgi:hypothetical protein
VKALLLAGAFTCAYAAAVTILFRLADVRRRVMAMTTLFLLTLPAYVIVYASTPVNLGFLSRRLVEPRPVVECGLGLFVYAALFFGGILQVYNLADRGFSLRVLIEIADAGNHGLSRAEIVKGYSGGRGLGWMIDKRLEGMLAQRLIAVDAAWCANTPKGARAAAVFRRLREFLQLEPARE